MTVFQVVQSETMIGDIADFLASLICSDV